MVRAPVMLATGFAGYGDAYQGLLDMAVFGAVVTNPVTLRPQHGTTMPRLAETNAGFVWDTGHANPGVRKVITQYGAMWARLGIPVIAHLPVEAPDDMTRTARALGSQAGIAALEVGLPSDASGYDMEVWLHAIQADCMLPVLAKLSVLASVEMAEDAAMMGYSALVIGTPPLGAAMADDEMTLVNGWLYGPTLHALTLDAVNLLRDRVDVPIVATGGIHALSDAEALLAVGADAVQVDSWVWRDPKGVETMARDMGLEDVV